MTNHFANSAKSALQNTFINQKEVSRPPRTLWHFGAAVGLLGGSIALACAVFLTFFQYFYGENQHGFWLYAVVLPLWVIGAHCLDKVEEIEKSARIENCKQHGMTKEECAKRESPDEL